MKLIEEGFLKRNKKLITISVLILLIFAVIGAGLGYMKSGENQNAISNMLGSQDMDVDNQTASISSIWLFTHNLTSNLIIIIGGLLFSILSVISIIINGVSIGSIFGVDLKYACAAVLPHGIIEYFAQALALTIAFKITQLEIAIIKNRNFKNTIEENKTALKDILVIFIVMIILLAIAAVIEGHITELVVSWVYGL